MVPKMRPRIEGAMEERVREYKDDAGFDDPADFVRYCVAKELDRREDMYATGDSR
jgi:hypothetical protein